jgi:uncharacterized protein
MPSPSPIEPSERIGNIDILRGIALFIVLLINAATEFRVSIFDQLLPGPRATGPADQVSETIILALHTKGFILFSFLFGVSLAIQFDRLTNTDQRFVLMLRRIAILLAIGLTHLFLIWNGDILTEYAIVGFAVLPFLYGPRWLLAAASALSIALYLAMPLLPPIISFPSGAWIIHHVEEARRAYGAGSFMDILAFRIHEVPYLAPLHVYALPRTFGLFLLGALVWRTGFFRRPISSRSLVVAACFALAVGAWMTIAAEKGEAFGWLLDWPGRYTARSLSQLVLAFGYGAMIVLLADNTLGRKFVGWAGPLGRMAFTNYLVQSITLSCIFYSFGFALFGRLSVAQAIAIAAAIYTAQAAFSAWWLGRFRFGPMEWLWRSLTYGELLRVFRAPAPAADLR